MNSRSEGSLALIGHPVALCALIASLVCAAAPPAVTAQEMDLGVFHYSSLDVDATRRSGVTLGRLDANGWVGTDFDRLWWSADGEIVDREVDGFEVRALYGRYFRRFWDVVVGYRHDIRPSSHGYLTVGLMGLAPYWFEVGAFGFVSDHGRPSVRLDAETDLFLTQRVVLTLEGEMDWLITPDNERDLAAGIAEVEAGFRVRYEIRRKFAPYVDLTWVQERGTRVPTLETVDTEGWRLGLGLRLIY